jgi:excisionase family DNA binding protein
MIARTGVTVLDSDASGRYGRSQHFGNSEDEMASRLPETDELLTPAEVAALFRVDPKTVTRWAKAGKLTSIRTLGGHRRYRSSEVRQLLDGIPEQRTPGESDL